MKKLLTIFSAFFVMLSISPAEALDNEETVSSVVLVQVENSQGEESIGSGFFFSVDGLVLTNAHVILDEYTNQPAEFIDLCPIEDEFSTPECVMSARVLSYDEVLDLAILYPAYSLDEEGNEIGDFLESEILIDLGIPYVDFADFTVSLGEEITIIGFPVASGLSSITLTQGIVSGFQTFSEPLDDWIWTMATDATINPGNSGGPVYNEDERVIGVATAYSANELGGSYGYITSVDAVYLWFADLVDEGILNEDFVEEAFSNDYVEEFENYDFDDLEIFPDVPNDHPNADAIFYLQSEGIIGGYDNGFFGPENPLNRAELMKILVEGAGVLPDPGIYNNCFPDITHEWYAQYICYAKERGWVGGYPDGEFKPGNDVNKAEAQKMMLEAYSIDLDTPTSPPYSDVKVSDWYATYVETSANLGLLEETGDLYEPAEKITRAQISENLYRLLLYGYDQTEPSLVHVSNIFLDLVLRDTEGAFEATHELFKFYTSLEDFEIFLDEFTIFKNYDRYSFNDFLINEREAEMYGTIESNEEGLYEIIFLYDMNDEDQWEVSGFEILFISD